MRAGQNGGKTRLLRLLPIKGVHHDNTTLSRGPLPYKRFVSSTKLRSHGQYS